MPTQSSHPDLEHLTEQRTRSSDGKILQNKTLGRHSAFGETENALVIGIDSSTSATKAIAWDRSGSAVAEGRAPISTSNPHPGWFEQDPAEWWSSATMALKAVTDQVDPKRIGGLAISQQRETCGVFRADGTPLRPGMLWLDERAKHEMRAFAERFGAELLHQISGKPLDITPALPLYVWLKENEPEVWDDIEKATDVNGYLTFKLIGDWTTSRVSADPSGLIDMATLDWSPEILDAIGLNISCLPRTAVPGEIMGEITAQAASATGLMPGTPVIAGGGDGQCAGTGTNILGPGRAYLNLGTAVVSGCFGETYVHNRAFRTMGAVAESGYIYETCLRTGTFLVDWIVERLFNLPIDPKTFNALESEAAKAPVGANGLIMVPYWSGSMTPHWDMDARGVFAGFNAFHTRGDMYRAVLEGIALDQTLVTNETEKVTGVRIENYVAIGGGAASDLWCQIIADVSGRTVQRSKIIEASALGAGMAAAKGAGWFATMADAANAMAGPIVDSIEPNPNNHARYGDLLDLYRDLWPALSDWNRRLVQFAEQGS